MPIYIYECPHCQSTQEVIQRITDDKLTDLLCSSCDTLDPSTRIIAPCDFHLGSGGCGWSKDGYFNAHQRNLDTL